MAGPNSVVVDYQAMAVPSGYDLRTRPPQPAVSVSRRAVIDLPVDVRKEVGVGDDVFIHYAPSQLYATHGLRENGSTPSGLSGLIVLAVLATGAALYVIGMRKTWLAAPPEKFKLRVIMAMAATMLLAAFVSTAWNHTRLWHLGMIHARHEDRGVLEALEFKGDKAYIRYTFVDDTGRRLRRTRDILGSEVRTPREVRDPHIDIVQIKGRLHYNRPAIAEARDAPGRAMLWAVETVALGALVALLTALGLLFVRTSPPPAPATRIAPPFTSGGPLRAASARNPGSARDRRPARALKPI